MIEMLSTFSFTLDSEHFMMLVGTEAAGQLQTFAVPE